MEAPSVTMEAPSVTMKAPQVTMEAPSVTMEAPSVTMEAPSVTMEAPPVTMEAPSVTTEAPTATAKPTPRTRTTTRTTTKDYDDEDYDDEDGSDLQTGDVVVVGSRIADPDEAPVPAFTVSQQELERQQPLSVNDVIRRVPGMQVRDEDGMGLRPNIGFRGLSSDRSRNVLVLEDGVPIQMMPYDYPELYVAPRIERMRSVEVIRGAASIIYGPRTIGGVVNFVTLAPPTELHVAGQARIGTDGYYFGHAMAGDTVGDVGFLITAMHQRFQGPRHLQLAQTDVMGRLNLDLHDAGELRVKLQFYDENSTSTNIGLTTTPVPERRAEQLREQ